MGTATAAAAMPAASKVPAASGSKSKYYIAAVTPCDSKLRFDEGIYKDMMSFFKERGADGVVVLGGRR
jgi:hypothetical protein